jgi:integrase
MAEKRIVVWVQSFKDRLNLMLRWHDPITNKCKSRSARTSDPAKAEAARVDLEADLNAGRYHGGVRMAWDKFRQLFEDEYVAARRQNTQENYSAMFDAFERLCNPQTIQGITERTLSAFAAALRKEPGRSKEGQAPSTIKQRLSLLQKALRWAVDLDLIPKCPKFPKIKVPKKRPQPVPLESFERLLARAPDANMRVFLLTGWLAGLRLSEAAALEWSPSETCPYVDLDHERIVLPAEAVKAEEDQWVSLDPQLRTELLALPRRGRKVFRFVSQRGAPVGLSAIGERIIRLAREAGVKLTMRSLRRGFGCYHAGRVPAQVLQRLMRHANIATTVAFYANVDEAARDAILRGGRHISRNSADEPQQAAAEPDSTSVESKRANDIP